MMTSSVRGKSNVSMDRGSMQHETDVIRNKQQTDRVDIKRRNGSPLRTAQQDDVEYGGDDEVDATYNFFMKRCVGLQ